MYVCVCIYIYMKEEVKNRHGVKEEQAEKLK